MGLGKNKFATYNGPPRLGSLFRVSFCPREKCFWWVGDLAWVGWVLHPPARPVATKSLTSVFYVVDVSGLVVVGVAVAVSFGTFGAGDLASKLGLDRPSFGAAQGAGH